MSTNEEKVGKTNVKRITLTEEDGSETVINVSDSLHFIFGFVNIDGEDPPMEILAYGSQDVIGEIYYQLGENHPGLIKHCVRRSTERLAKKVMDEIGKSGIDPIGEALKKMPTPPGGGGWN